MGLLDKLQEYPGLAGLTSLAEGTHGSLMKALARVLVDSGGFNAALDAFRSKGMEAQVRSWIGRGRNLPITAEQVEQGLGAERIEQIAAEAHMKPSDVKIRLSTMLPTLVDRITPNGSLNDEFINRGLAQLTGDRR